MRRIFVFFLFFISFTASGQRAGRTDAPSARVTDDSITELNKLSEKLLDNAPEKAFVLSKRALEASEKIQFKKGMAEAMTNLGFYYQDQANYKSALNYFIGAKKLYAEINDSLLVARSYRHLGGLYRQQALYEQAETYYQEAIALARKNEDAYMVGNCLKDLGGLAYFLKQHDRAIAYFNQSLDYFDQDKDSTSYAAVLNNLGVVHKALKNYGRSLRYLQQAYVILQQQQSIRDLSAVLMNIGEVHERLGHFDEAEHHYQLALQAASKVDNMQRMVEAYDYLAKFYAAIEHYDKAYFYKNLFAAFQDSLHRQEVDFQMAEMAKRLETERKERAFSQLIQDKELQLLNQENKINRLELYRKNNFILLTILLAIMACGGFYALYKGYQVKRKQNQRLENQNQQIVLKNEQLQEMNRRLQASEDQLKDANKTKDKFFGILAHDLRSPLMTLKGFVQVLHQEHASFSKVEMNRLTGRIEHSLKGLTSLLDNLLQWSVAQSGIIEFAPRTIRLQKLVEENIQLLETTAQVKDICLVKTISTDLVYADKQMLHLIIRNLLSNAIKFTPRGGKVYIEACETELHTRLQVKDTGVGISPEKLKHLLQENVLRSSRGTENEKGSGLGLWLCKDFVERHRGSMKVESELGKGSVFTILLPKFHQQQPQLI